MVKVLIERIKRKIKSIYVNGENNEIDIKCKIKKGRINVIGSNNYISIPKSCCFNNAEVIIYGDNNKLVISEYARLLGPCKVLMEGNATLVLGENVGIRGVDFSLKHGKVSVGELSMFSYGIKIRNHDSHRVFPVGGVESECPCNLPADISIGRHVWICQDASILKGVSIGDESIVAFGAVVTKDCPANSIVAGNPAKVVKTGIRWDY